MSDLDDIERLKKWDPNWINGAPFFRILTKTDSRSRKTYDFIESRINENPEDLQDPKVVKVAGLIYMEADAVDFLCLYRLNGKLAGVLAMSENKIIGVLVMPSARRNGVGQALVQEAVRRSCELDQAKKGHITFAPLDDEAEAFYKKLGAEGGDLYPDTANQWILSDKTYKIVRH